MAPTGTTAREAQILDWLGSQQDAMLAMIETVVNIDSEGTQDVVTANSDAKTPMIPAMEITADTTPCQGSGASPLSQ